MKLTKARHGQAKGDGSQPRNAMQRAKDRSNVGTSRSWSTLCCGCLAGRSGLIGPLLACSNYTQVHKQPRYRFSYQQTYIQSFRRHGSSSSEHFKVAARDPFKVFMVKDDLEGRVAAKLSIWEAPPLVITYQSNSSTLTTRASSRVHQCKQRVESARALDGIGSSCRQEAQDQGCLGVGKF